MYSPNRIEQVSFVKTHLKEGGILLLVESAAMTMKRNTSQGNKRISVLSQFLFADGNKEEEISYA